MCLQARLALIARQHPGKTALSIGGKSQLTFGELASRSDALARALVGQGLAAGDRVGILAGHNLDALVLFWAVQKAGAGVVWLNDQYDPGELQSVVADASPRMVFAETDKQFAALGDSPGVTISRLEHVNKLEQAATDDTILPAVSGEHLAAIVYTSGSSGKPKGVALSHGNLLSVADAVVEHMPISAQDSYLMVVPLHYVHGLMQLLVHAIAGCTIYFSSNFMFPRKIVQLLEQTRVTGFSGVPYHFNALLDRGGLADATLPNLRWVTVTGGKLPASRIADFKEALPDVEFHIAYGQTECSPRATALHPSKALTKPDSVGAAIPGVSVHLLDDAGHPVAAGETGEVVIEGPNVMLGYWQDEAATRAAVDVHGRLHTGDLGRFDEDGDLFLVGRQSAMIKSAGERIVPEEIENVLATHPAVGEAVVIGVDDPLLGQRVVAYIVPDPAHVSSTANSEALIADIRDHCLKSVPFARAPREYHVRDDVPRKPNGKPDRQALGKPEA